MKPEYKYIYFQEELAKTKTKKYILRSKDDGSVLGVVKWYASWRKYCFFPDSGLLVFCSRCLADIQDFINNLMLEWREARNEQRRI